MADSTPTPTPSSSKSAAASSSSSSCFHRTVSLSDWWLIRAEHDFQGKRLAVSGIPSNNNTDPSSSSKLGKGAMRVFVSAPVTKRHDLFSLETADGVYIMIRGFINKERTLENGFPDEVFNHFLFGFPTNWEKYDVNCFEESVTRNDSSCAVPDKVPGIDGEILCDGVEKPTPTTTLVSPKDALGDHEMPFREGVEETTPTTTLASPKDALGDHEMPFREGVEETTPTTTLASPKDALGDHEMPFHEGELNASKEIAGVNVVNASGGNRRITRSHNIKICQMKNKHASGCQHKDKEQVNTSGDHEKPFHEDGLNVSKENAGDIGVHGSRVPYPGDECDQSKEMGGVIVSGRTRRSTRLHNVKVSQQKNKPASGCPRKHTDKELISTSVALVLENPDVEELKSAMMPAQSQSLGQVNASSEQLVKKSASRISRALSINTEGTSKKKRVVEKQKVISPKRKMTRSTSAMIYRQERDGSPLVKVGTENISSVCRKALNFDNADGEGLKSPVTPVQSKSQGQANTSSEQLVKNSASRLSRTLSPKNEGSCNKKRARDKTNATTPKVKMIESASAVKYPREGDVSEKILVSPKSLSIGKSRSGRLLIPRLDFWRNQIPVYNLEREVTEIQDGASLLSPFKGPSPSVNSKSKNQKLAAAWQ